MKMRKANYGKVKEGLQSLAAPLPTYEYAL